MGDTFSKFIRVVVISFVFVFIGFGRGEIFVKCGEGSKKGIGGLRYKLIRLVLRGLFMWVVVIVYIVCFSRFVLRVSSSFYDSFASDGRWFLF